MSHVALESSFWYLYQCYLESEASERAVDDTELPVIGQNVSGMPLMCGGGCSSRDDDVLLRHRSLPHPLPSSQHVSMCAVHLKPQQQSIDGLQTTTVACVLYLTRNAAEQSHFSPPSALWETCQYLIHSAPH